MATVPLNSGLGGATQTATLADEFKVFYEKRMLVNMRANLVHQQFGMQETIPRNSGSTVQWRRWSPIPTQTTPLTEGVIPDGLGFTVNKVEASINEYGFYVKGTDMVDVLAYDNLLNGIATEIGAAAGETLDEVTRDVLVAGTNVIYAGTATSRLTVAATMVLGIEELTRFYAQMRVNRARPYKNGRYPLIIHPYQAADLQRDSAVRAAFNSGDRASSSDPYNGFLGDFMGLDFYVTDKAKEFAGAGASGANVYAAVGCGQDAYAVIKLASMDNQFIFKGKGSAGTSDPLDQFWTSGWKAVYAAARLREPFILRIESGATNG